MYKIFIYLSDAMYISFMVRYSILWNWNIHSW